MPHSEVSRRLVRVRLTERAYDIEIGAGRLAEVGRFVADRGPFSKGVVVTDKNVYQPHAVAALESLTAAGLEADVIIVEPGEATKSIDVANGLWNTLCESGADRKAVVVAVGGGVVGDLAGFVAATYARGIAFVQVPTTLLAQVDSSVGGKTGVNLPSAKNLVGVFWQPAGVLIDTAVLHTLPEREYRAGLAEVIKYGVILDADFFALLEANSAAINARDEALLAEVVTRCCQLKANIVEQDERETTGLRAVLNYGHTFAHAIEAVTRYGELLHGEAVSIGMTCAARLAQTLGRVDDEFVDRQAALLTAVGLPIDCPALDRASLLAAMQRDKKTERGKLRFVLPSRLGHVELVDGVDNSQATGAFESAT